MVCPYLTGLWTFRCLARDDFVIPSITEETRYCLGKGFERCPHFPRPRRRTGRGRSLRSGRDPGANSLTHP